MNAETVQTESDGAGIEVAPSRSTPATLIGVFTDPKGTFASLRDRPRILAPILVCLVFQLIFGVVLMQSGVIKNDMVTQLESKDMAPEQIERATGMMDSPIRFLFVGFGAAAFVFSLLAFAGVIYFMANLMLGAKLRYAHYLCVVAYGAVVGIVDQAVRMGLAVARGSLTTVHLGVGAFLGEQLTAPMRILDTATDPLLLWATAIEALGVAVMAKKGFGFGALAVLPCFLLLVSLSALRQ